MGAMESLSATTVVRTGPSSCCLSELKCSLGRQLDGAVGSLEMLPSIVDAVGDQLTVLFDSGIRTGADIVKALSLGAKAVLVGRPPIYGLAVGGKVCSSITT